VANKRLDALRAKRDGINEKLAHIDEAVSLRADLSMTEDETTEYEALRGALGQVTKDIDDLAEQFDRQRATSETLARIGLADAEARGGIVSNVRERAEMSSGQWASLYLRAQAHDAEAAAELDAFYRAADLTSDVSGIVPTTITGDLVKYVDPSRPAISASRVLPMPEKGSAFPRPRVSQSTTIATQSTQDTALGSQKMTITSDSVSKVTKGGFVTISEQVIDWTDPAFLQILFEDLAQQYAIATETAHTASIVTAATNKVTGFTVGTSAADVFQTKLAAAAGTVYTNAKRLPNVLFAAVSTWQYIVGLADGNKRPLFPLLGAQNVPGASGASATEFTGANPQGLVLVVSPQFATDTCVVAATSLVEFYEQNKGLAQIAAPSTMSIDVAYRGYIASNVYANGLCSMQTT
jgi:HK97 family phage major capsid protein